MKPIIWFIIGIASGGLVVSLLSQPNSPLSNDAKEATTTNASPLYWVAPMDPNYRRDKPGKSPMGMDLIPVYEQTDKAAVSISANIEHQLGITTSTVTRGILRDTIRVSGKVAFNENDIHHLHPRVEGWIEKLFVRAKGESVKVGQALYSIYSPELSNAQEEYLLALDKGSSALINATQQRLIALGMPRVSLQSLEKTRKIQASVTIYSPISGVVEMLPIREGFFVKPDANIMSIAALDSVWVLLNVPLYYEQSLQPNQQVTIQTISLPNHQWRSHIEYIYPTIDEKTQTLMVRVVLDNSTQALKPNAFVEANIDVTHPQTALLVPTAAVIRDGTHDRIVVQDAPGQYRSINVGIGMVNSEQTQVISGLQEGQNVVTSGQFLIDSESNIAVELAKLAEEEVEKANDNTATVTGTVINIDGTTLTIARGPIAKWGRGPATMSFSLSSDISIRHIASGDKVIFTFVADQGEFTIIELVKVENPTPSSSSQGSHHDH